MSYYRALGLSREPFSTSPDPSFLYLSPAHRAALYRIRINVELKRGLTVVVGDIGTGKTTLARRLSQIFYEDLRVDMHAILNPMFHSDDEFLQHLMNSFHIERDSTAGPITSIDCLQAIERYLFEKGVKEGKTIILLIDEAQQLSLPALEIIRALLNYETNDFKLLQVILFGQNELIPKLQTVRNFWDRISVKLHLPPLDMPSTQAMIEYRLKQAQYMGQEPLFTHDAVKRIYKKTAGYPRRITMLCHDALEYLFMNERHKVDGQMIKDLVQKEKKILALTH